MQVMKPHMKNKAVTAMKAKRLLDRAEGWVMDLGFLDACEKGRPPCQRCGLTNRTGPGEASIQ